MPNSCLAKKCSGCYIFFIFQGRYIVSVARVTEIKSSSVKSVGGTICIGLVRAEPELLRRWR
jgi:hypothetical protein